MSEKMSKGLSKYFQAEIQNYYSQPNQTKTGGISGASDCCNVGSLSQVWFWLDLQFDPSLAICNLGKNTVSELWVDKIMKHLSCVSGARLDIALMSSCSQLVIALYEAKKAAAGVSSKTSIKDIEHLAAYMFSVLAFSHWGVGRKEGNEPISGLLLYPTAIYRLSIWKPTQTDQCPFGFMYKIEMTHDPLMGGYLKHAFKNTKQSIEDWMHLRWIPRTWILCSGRLSIAIWDSIKINWEHSCKMFQRQIKVSCLNQIMNLHCGRFWRI